jgi:hypothetical protein
VFSNADVQCMHQWAISVRSQELASIVQETLNSAVTEQRKYLYTYKILVQLPEDMHKPTIIQQPPIRLHYILL